MPKSSSFGAPSRVTRMLRALMSRWTTSRSWEYWTAAHTRPKSASRSRTGRCRAAQYTSIGSPSTYSITTYGTPPSDVPASSRRAMSG